MSPMKTLYMYLNWIERIPKTICMYLNRIGIMLIQRIKFQFNSFQKEYA